MIDIRIVCTHDAVKLAETLMRLLEAEQHVVRLVYGRQAGAQLEAAKTAREAVLLIWSPDAPGQLYMHEWARQIDPARRVEIATASGWPRIERDAPVIDFASWKGVRGARAWNALVERLRAVSRPYDPPQPLPKRALAGAGAGAFALIGAVTLVWRSHQEAQTPQFAALEPELSEISADAGVGGPLTAIEPASVEDLAVHPIANPHFTPIAHTDLPDLMETPDLALADLPEPTLLDRLRSLNPLRDDQSTGDN
ncbi:MAG: hypothetical protein JNJ63_07395 [Hyphomonadaceae bacterium]|nr:hypothetical protein [Hyphomonadaceae bacterium]